MGRLGIIQEVMAALWTTPEGYHALNTEGGLGSFLDRFSLTATEKQWLISTPPQRLEVYGYGVWINTFNTMVSVYPHTMAWLGEDAESVTRDYFWRYPNSSYRLVQAGDFFPEYLQQQEEVRAKVPFIAELALYEKMRRELRDVEETPLPNGMEPFVPDSLGALPLWRPVFNPAAVLIYFQYPIHRLIEQPHPALTKTIDPESSRPKGVSDDSPGYCPEIIGEEPTALSLYREPSPSFQCKCLAMSPLLAKWIEETETALTDLGVHSGAVEPPGVSSGDSYSYFDSLVPFIQGYQVFDEGFDSMAFQKDFLALFSQLFEKKIILGSVRCSSSFEL